MIDTLVTDIAKRILSERPAIAALLKEDVTMHRRYTITLQILEDVTRSIKDAGIYIYMLQKESLKTP